jgi:NAD(P)-dependent dehydrogenase (short-subunit alcohol dehydrogenase family)
MVGEGEPTSTIIVGYGQLARHLGYLFGKRSDTRVSFITRRGTPKDLGSQTPVVAGDLRHNTSIHAAFSRLDKSVPPWKNIIFLAKQSTPSRWPGLNPDVMAEDIAVSAVGALRVLQSATTRMRRSQDASFTLVSSDFGRQPNPEYLGLSMAKAALGVFGVAVRDELQKQEDIRVLVPMINGELGHAPGQVSHVAAAQEIYDHIVIGRYEKGIFDVALHNVKLRAAAE